MTFLLGWTDSLIVFTNVRERWIPSARDTSAGSFAIRRRMTNNKAQRSLDCDRGELGLSAREMPFLKNMKEERTFRIGASLRP
jgi:hypothetical protein